MTSIKPYSEYEALRIKSWMFKVVILGLIGLLSCVNAQVRGVLSLVDLDPTSPERFEDCLSGAPDEWGILECTTGVEIVDEAKRVECLNRGNVDCERYAFNIPMYPDKLGLTVEKVYKKLWSRYVRDVKEFAKDKMKEAGCWASAYPSTVLPQVITYAHTEAAVRYWKEVFIASLYYMPAALWWHSPFPDDGGVLVPSYSLVPKPQVYMDLAREAGAKANYYFQPPAFPSTPFEYSEADITEGWPGLYNEELLKQGFFNNKLSIPTALEYNQFGHTSFFRAYGRRSMKVFVVFESSCIPPPPGKSPVGVFPVPFIPRADTEWLSVAEGYPLDNSDIANDYWIPAPRAAFFPPRSALDAESLLSANSSDLLGLLSLGGGLGGIGGLGGGPGSFLNFSGSTNNANPLETYLNDLGDGYDDILTLFDLGSDLPDAKPDAGNLTDLIGDDNAEGADSNDPGDLLLTLDSRLLTVSPLELAKEAVNRLPGGDFDDLDFGEKIRTVSAFASAREGYIRDQLRTTDAEGNTSLDPSRLGGIRSGIGGLASFSSRSESGTSFGTQSFPYGSSFGFGGGPGGRSDLDEVLNCPALSVKPGERGPYPILDRSAGGIVRTEHYNDATRYLFDGYSVSNTYTEEMNQNLQAFKEAFGLPGGVVDTRDWVPSYTVLCDGDEGGEVRRLNSMLGGGGSRYDAERVKNFQAENGLEPDGVTGPETWLALSARGGLGLSQLENIPLTFAKQRSDALATPLGDSQDKFQNLLAQSDPPANGAGEDDGDAGEASPEAEDVSYPDGAAWPDSNKNYYSALDGLYGLERMNGDQCSRYHGEIIVRAPVIGVITFDTSPLPASWLAAIALRNRNITWATENPPNPDTPELKPKPDGSDPLSNITAAAAGLPAKRSNGLASFGGETYLSPDMLEGLLILADHYQIRVSAIAGGDHAAGSPHYGGGAFQIDMINGQSIEAIAAKIDTDTSVNVINKTYQWGGKLRNTCDWGSGESPIVQALALCGAADAVATSGPTSDTIGRRDHIMCAWPTKTDFRE